MATGGAALLLCAVFFLSSAHPACSCPTISQFSCRKGTAEYSKNPQQCGVNHFRCRDSKMEIQFGGKGPWYRVVGEHILFDDNSLEINSLEIEDPTLSPIFEDTDCDFLYKFPQPGLPFTPPRTSANSPRDLQSYCSASDYGALFSSLITAHQGVPCFTYYDLHFTSKRPQHFLDPAARNNCLPAHPYNEPSTAKVIWSLSMDNTSNGSFNILSVGFSHRHGLYPHCFLCEMTGGLCDAGSAGSYTCGRKARHTVLRIFTIGFPTATGLSILGGLLLYLRHRHKKMKTPTSSTLLSHTASLEPCSEEYPEATSIICPSHVFRYEELHEATHGFSPSNELDHGGHGIVYRGTLSDGRIVAIKRLYENSCKRAEQFLNEIAILGSLRHPNLVALYGCTSRHSRELLLVYEFIPNGTIADHLHGRRATEGVLDWPLRLRIAVETATALAYLHAITPQIVHRDVKTNNILLDVDFHVKVADFGLSRLFPVGASHVSTVPQGTPGYVDPEYHRCYQLTDKSDVYSFGVVLAELISSKPAVDVTRSQNEINLSNMALNKIPNAALQELVDPKLGFEADWEVRRSIEMVAELVIWCLQMEKAMRPTMEDALELLQGIADGLHRAEKAREADHTVGDGEGLNAKASPNTS